MISMTPARNWGHEHSQPRKQVAGGQNVGSVLGQSEAVSGDGIGNLMFEMCDLLMTIASQTRSWNGGSVHAAATRPGSVSIATDPVGNLPALAGVHWLGSR
jgi:hypothetical protein